MTKSVYILASMLALAATSVSAEQPGSTEKGTAMRHATQFYFQQMDTNGDGFVTRDEMRAMADKMFDEADTRHDGKLTVDDLMNQEIREKNAFKVYMGKNTSDTSNATKLKSD